MQKRINSLGGIKINYDINKLGGSFLIFLHGAGGDLTAWKKERDFFHKKGISTLAIDLRGHGKSGRPDKLKEYGLEYSVNDVYAVITKEKIKKFVLVGHCFGGMVGITFHKFYPELAKAYIFIDTTYKAHQKLRILIKGHPFFVSLVNYLLEHKSSPKHHLVHAKFEKYKGTSDWDIFRIADDLLRMSFKSWLFTFEALSEFDGVRVIKTIKQPTLIIEGERDSIFDVLKAKKIHKLIKSSELDIIPKENHIIILNNPRVINLKIFRFLNRIFE